MPSPRVIGIALLVVLCLVGAGFSVFQLTRGHEAQPEEQAPQKSEEELAREASIKQAKQIVNEMTLEQKVAQLFVVRPEAITGVEAATEAGQATRAAIADYPVCGLLYSDQNFIDEKQLVTLLKNTQNYVKDASGVPALMCVEEEGGAYGPVAASLIVSTEVDGAAKLGTDNEVEHARDAARQIGEYLRDLGFNTNLAPVADAADSAGSDISDRSFGSEPSKVAALVSAQVDGYQRAGVLCAVKHFPGIGEAEKDLHNDRLYSHRTKEELMRYELVPFAEAIEADAPIVVVSNMSCLQVGNGEGDVPSWMSKTIVGDILREDLGFDGVAMTDQLDDESMAEVCEPSEQAVRAVQAGIDVVVCPQDFERAYRGLLKAVEKGDITESRIDESVMRIVLLKESLPD